MEQIIGFIQTVYAFIATNLGLKADASDATGTLHAKATYIADGTGTNTDVSSISGGLNAKISSFVKYTIASANIKHSALTARTTQSITYVKLKEVIMPGYGTIRVTFKMKSSSGTATCEIFKNGVATGVLFTQGNTLATKTADISASKGDAVQLYLLISSASFIATVQDYTIGYDFDSLEGVTLD